MRRPLVAGNWKMHTVRSEAVALAEGIAGAAAAIDGADVLVCPPFPYLEAVGRALEGTAVSLGAQNLHEEPAGAFTGEVSGAMLADVGCRYVIVGHSERRHQCGESNDRVGRKLKAALDHQRQWGGRKPGARARKDDGGSASCAA